MIGSKESDLRDKRWERIFRTVPRHPFLSAGFYTDGGEDSGDGLCFVSASTDGELWLRRVYSDVPLVTRVDEKERPLSSSSAPSVMARFLELLDVQDGNTVLEIGTGTGYNAALLCNRVRSENLTTIDIDATVAREATIRLKQCGFTPTVATADGHGGYPLRAPYDRIISTASVPRIPEAWIEQLRPGGVIVTPLCGRMNHGLIGLRASSDGSVEGRFHPKGVAFMALRTDSGSYGTDPMWGDLFDIVYDAPGGDEQQCALADWLSDPWRSWSETTRLVQLSIPTLEWIWPMAAVVDRMDLSWARVYSREDGLAVVRQGGPRRLWDEMMGIHERSLGLGRPEIGRYGMTVTKDRHQWVWLDSVDSEYRWGL